MKNLHILPTDKPSRLYYSGNISNLLLSKEPISFRTFERSTQNIYITSDEEIKEDGYVFWEGKIYKYREFMKMRTPVYTDYFSIILTTDQDLIKDGVQAIDDEFLEWFVKNPSCEEVKTIKVPYFDESGYSHLLIIPKEEPKQGTMSEAIKQVISNQLKQETTLEDIELEEVRGSIHCQFSVVENKLAIIYRNQLKILQAIKMLNNER